MDNPKQFGIFGIEYEDIYYNISSGVCLLTCLSCDLFKFKALKIPA